MSKLKIIVKVPYTSFLLPHIIYFTLEKNSITKIYVKEKEEKRNKSGVWRKEVCVCVSVAFILLNFV